MCTIIVRHRMDIRWTTLIAANRDEFYARRAEPPQVLDEDRRIVGGRDVEKGGTWFGVTPEGCFLGVTNQRSWGGSVDGLKSRGQLVLDVLRAGSLDEMKEALSSVDAREYNSFNAIFGDGKDICAAYGRNDVAAVELEPLTSGVHVLCNDRLGSKDFPKASDTKRRVLSIARRSWKHMHPALHEVLRDHALPDLDRIPAPPAGSLFDHPVVRQLQAICIHTPVYGTVSSSMAALKQGEVTHYVHAEGPPCTTEYVDFTHLVGGRSPVSEKQ